MASAAPARGSVAVPIAVFIALLAAGCADRWLADAPRAPPPEACAPGTTLDTAAGRCVERGCSSDDDCARGLRCDRISASCVASDGRPGGVGEVPQPRICDEGARRCDRYGGGVEICIDGGWAVEACPDGLSCTAGRCVACRPGEKRCGAPGQVESCALDGSAWVAESCPGADPVCIDGACRTCEPGASLCEGSVGLVVCNSLGTGWEARTCAADSRCVEEGENVASCRTVVCTPGARRCDPGNASVQESCADDGSGWVVDACPSGQSCEPSAGGCVDACGLAAVIRGSDGCGFSFAELPNASGLLERTASRTLLVRNDRSDPVRLQLLEAGAAVGDSLHLAPNQTIPIDVPAGGGGWRLESSGPVTAQLVHRAEGWDATGCACRTTGCSPGDPCLTFDRSADATLLLPDPLLGKSDGDSAEYLAITPRHQRDGDERPALLTLVGGTAPATVEIQFAGPTRRTIDGVTTSWSAGDIAAFSVAPYEVLQFASAPSGPPPAIIGGSRPRSEFDAGLTGTRITTAGPVAVFSGADCSREPLAAAACDHVEAQLLPRHLWGRRYVGMRYGDGDRWFVGAGEDTLILLSRPVDFGNGTAQRLITVPAGKVLEFRADGDFELLAWAPVLLGQIAGSPTTGAQASLVMAQPAERFQTAYRLLLPRNGSRTLHLQVPVADGAQPQVRVAGVSVSGWTRLTSGLLVARVPLCAGAGSPCDPEGAYLVQSTEPAGVTAWVEEGGYASESRSTFGFVGGLGGDPSVVRPQPY